jgi:hypothetical protein
MTSSRRRRFPSNITEHLSSSNKVRYGNLVINNPTEVSLGLALASPILDGNLTVMSGTLNNAGFSITGSASSTFQVDAGATFTMAGTSGMATGFGSFSFDATSTVDYAGSNQTVANHNYGNLTLSGSGTKTLPSSPLSIAGDLTFSGTTSASAANGLVVGGDVNIEPGASFTAGSFNHQVNGDIQIAGSFDPGSGTFTLNGTSAQTIAGNPAAVYENLVIDNSAGVILWSPVTVNGTLFLVNGRLELDDHDVTVGASGGVSGGSAASYVLTNGYGKMIRTVDTSPVLFPVGTYFSFAPATVQMSAGSGTYSVIVDPGVSPPTANNDAALDLMWYIESTGNRVISSDLTITFQWNETDEGPDFDRGSCVSWTFNGEGWVEEGVVTGVSGSNPYAATVTAVSTDGSFTMGTDGALPIQLAYFSGSVLPNSSDVELRWGTISETNNFGFQVQRKEEASTEFIDLPGAFIPGQGTTTVPHEYHWTDAHVPPGSYHYRLKQIDLDGTLHYTDPIHITISGVSSVTPREVPKEFSVAQNYPNPFNPGTRIEYTVEGAGTARLTVYNLLGQVIRTESQQAEPGRISYFDIDAHNLPSGVYFYMVAADGKSTTKRMILQK